ncbi:MAG: flagellar basal body-associated FliL family protein [Nitrospirae bacterium]|nr:flagellar basal body-associated FliL family protein [Nitrospirota bacterium]
MEEEKHSEEGAEAHAKPAAKGGKKKLMIIVLAAILVLGGAGGFVGYRMLSQKGEKAGEEGGHKKEGETKTALVAVDPFVVNLTEHGRYLKVTLQLELSDATQQPSVAEKMPNIRDAIITLLSSKSAETVSGPEGKIQLKDELLLRTNQAVGKDLFKNLYFTEFVMQ